MSKNILTWFIVTIILAVAVSSCVSPPSLQSLNEKTLAAMLSQIDPWPDGSTNYSEASWKQLISTAQFIQKCKPKSVEQAFLEYQSIQEFDQEVHSDSKIYLLLRVAFVLPENASTDEWTMFGGWATMNTERNEDGTVNLAWPLTWNKGNPRLISGFTALQGFDARYKAAAEYKYFRGKYPFRDLSSFKY